MVIVEFVNVQLCSVLLTAMCWIITVQFIHPSDGISDSTPCLSPFPQTMDSELSHSMVGSYLNPPERMYLPSFTQNEAFQNHHLGNSPKMFNSPNNQGNINMKLYRKSGAAHGTEITLPWFCRKHWDCVWSGHTTVSQQAAAITWELAWVRHHS